MNTIINVSRFVCVKRLLSKHQHKTEYKFLQMMNYYNMVSIKNILSTRGIQHELKNKFNEQNNVIKFLTKNLYLLCQ